MSLFAPFTGTLYLPDKEFLTASTPVRRRQRLTV